MFVRVQHLPVSSPFEPLMNFGQGIDDLFDGFLRKGSSQSSYAYPAVDIAEYENETVVVAEMPGVNKEDLKLSVHDGALTISGQRKAHQLPENSSWLRNEIREGEFTRTIQLPHEVNVDSISAELTNGILRVVLPKSEHARPREIKVQ